MRVIRREAVIALDLVSPKVVDRPPHTSSVSTSFVDFSLPVRCCLGMSKFPAVLQSAPPSCSRVSFFISLELSFQPTSLFSWPAAVVVVPRYRVTYFEGAISSRRSVMIALYCSVRWSMLESESSGVYSADNLNRLMKSSGLNVRQVRRVVIT